MDHRGRKNEESQNAIVPLPPLARDILKSVKPIAGDLAFTTTGQDARLRRLEDQEPAGRGDAIPAWRLHDLRRSAATGMAELGIAPHIVEAALNHISGAKASVAGTYNRAAYAPEKKIALERWAAHVHGLVSGKPANIVSLPGKRQK